MRRRHIALISTAVAALALSGAGVGLVDCAAPTQIVIEIYSDACPGTNAAGQINKTEITVGNATNVDFKPPAASHDFCEKTPANGVGTLTIYPSGANDAEVAIKVVAGVDPIGPGQCHPPDYPGCIVNRRDMHFIPNTSQHVRVDLSLACLNRVCPSSQTCDNGTCKSQADILPDGGTKPDAAITEAGLADGAIVDAGSADACAQCSGTCDPGKSCTIDCKTKACSPTEECSPTLPCTFTCDGTGRCNDINCTTSSTCTVNCGDPKNSCNKVTCNAATCLVNCNGNSSCNGDGGIYLDASTAATLNCSGDKACGTASCNSPDCKLTCNPNQGAMNACPQPAPCSGGCQDWNP